jgi:hypothetical protein
MTILALSSDELALLRFTCDLFFVEESPLWPLEATRAEPKDYGDAYRSLTERGIVDARGFRIADGALNRIAPVTECDARVSHVVVGPDGKAQQTDYWLLDEIAVSYSLVMGKHLFGDDLDRKQLVEKVARGLVPRRASGELLALNPLSALEVVALSTLLALVRAADGLVVPLPALRDAYRKPPPEPAPGAGMPFLARRPARPHPQALVVDPSWDEALRGLLAKGAFRVEGAGVRAHPGLVDLARAEGGERHTLVRTDFGEDDWYLRETTLIPADGTLFVLGPRRGGFFALELDGASLRAALDDALGPLPRERQSPARRVGELLRREPIRP